MAMLSAATVEWEMKRQFARAQNSGNAYVDVNSGELHRDLGGYPGRNHRMPVVCEVLRRLMGENDSILAQPPKGRGASLTIRYALPW